MREGVQKECRRSAKGVQKECKRSGEGVQKECKRSAEGVQKECKRSAEVGLGTINIFDLQLPTLSLFLHCCIAATTKLASMAPGRAAVIFKCVICDNNTAIDGPTCKNLRCEHAFKKLARPFATRVTASYNDLRVNFKDGSRLKFEVLTTLDIMRRRIKCHINEVDRKANDHELETWCHDDDLEQEPVPPPPQQPPVKANSEFKKFVEHGIRVKLMDFIVTSKAHLKWARPLWEQGCRFDQWDFYFKEISESTVISLERMDPMAGSPSFDEHVLKANVRVFLTSLAQELPLTTDELKKIWESGFGHDWNDFV
jgi:hypothetical protein